MMKKLFLFIGLLLQSGVAFAQQAVDLNLMVSVPQVGVGETFEVALEARYAGEGSINVGNNAIPGLENFEILGKASSTNMQIPNGARAATSKTTFSVRAVSEGTFVLGPVNLNLEDVTNATNEQISSGAVQVVVSKKAVKNNDENESDLGKGDGNDYWLWIALVIIIAAFARVFFGKKKTIKNVQKEELLSEVKFEQKIKNEHKEQKELPKIESEKFYLEAKDYLWDFFS